MRAVELWPRGEPWWLEEADAWSSRTGVPLESLPDNETICLGEDGCGKVFDRSDLAQVAAHMRHEITVIEPGKYLGKQLEGG